jgi:hypothetical protein
MDSQQQETQAAIEQLRQNVMGPISVGSDFTPPETPTREPIVYGPARAPIPVTPMHQPESQVFSEMPSHQELAVHHSALGQTASGDGSGSGE